MPGTRCGLGARASAVEYGPVTFVEIVLDARVPPNALRAAVNGERVTITVSPEVEAAALAVLDEAIGMAVAEVMDQAGAPDGEPAVAQAGSAGSAGMLRVGPQVIPGLRSKEVASWPIRR